jgi:hypothetical protein
MRLHDVIVNETPKFQSLNPTKLSHYISVRGGNVEDVLVIPLELHDVVSCFPTFKHTQLECEACDRYELNYESPDYDPYATTFHEQEASMIFMGKSQGFRGLSTKETPILFPPPNGSRSQATQLKVQ